MRALEKGTAKGFEGLETEGAEEVNAAEEMERAKREIQEREEKKSLTMGGQHVQAAPKMNIKVSIDSMVRVASKLIVGGVGCCAEWTGQGKASVVDAPYGGVPEQRGFGGEDCSGPKKQEGGRKQIRCVLSPCRYSFPTNFERRFLKRCLSILLQSASHPISRNIITLYAGNYICMYTCTLKRRHSMVETMQLRQDDEKSQEIAEEIWMSTFQRKRTLNVTVSAWHLMKIQDVRTGDRLGALGNGVLRQLSWENESDRRLDLA